VQLIPSVELDVNGFVVKLWYLQRKKYLLCRCFLDLGTYPIFLARETTFSLKVALSIKTSLLTMLALYEEIYVLYARTSINCERLDPSKS
jgi:hypothetical protein